jgi:Tfp pilus assembly protein PilN
MYPELTNLLPARRIRAFRRGYFIRLAVLLLVMLSGITILSAGLLAPSYFYAHGEIARQTQQLNGLDASLQTSEEKQVRVRLAQLADNVTYLDRLATTTTASAAIGALLQVPHAGISLSGFTFAPPSGIATGRMTLSGVAASRDALQAYALALGQLPFVSKADLPISAYAKDTDIQFTITLSGTLRP